MEHPAPPNSNLATLSQPKHTFVGRPRKVAGGNEIDAWREEGCPTPNMHSTCSAGVALLPLGNLDQEVACPMELPHLRDPGRFRGQVVEASHGAL